MKAVFRASQVRTVAAFAKSIGISGPMASTLIEDTANLSLETARKVSARYGYRVGWLLEGEEPEKPDVSRVAERQQAYARGLRDALGTLRRLADDWEAKATAIGAVARAGKAARAGRLPTVKDAKDQAQKPGQEPPEDRAQGESG